MKHDIRTTWRDFAGVYLAILLGVVIVPLLFNNITLPFANTLAGIIIASIVIGTIVVTIISLFHIFLTSVYSKQGYLTMTLPVSSSQLVFSKLVVSTMWIVLTGIVSIIGLFIFFAVLNPAHVDVNLSSFFGTIMSTLSGRGYLAVALIILIIIASVIKEIAKLFLACSIGHLKQLNRFRVPAGIASYFACSWLESLLIQGINAIVSLFPQTDRLINQINAVSDPSQIQGMIGVLNGVVAAGIVYVLAVAFAYSAGTVWIMNHKLDLD